MSQAKRDQNRIPAVQGVSSINYLTPTDIWVNPTTHAMLIDGTSLYSSLDTRYVMLTTDQTIAGIKTFSSFPITPSSAPTTNYQVANKKYVDDAIGVENLWDRTGTVLTPHNAGDTASINVTGSLTGAASLNVLKAGDFMTGGLTIQPSTDTLTALVVNDKDANNVLTVDTINNKIGIGTTTPTFSTSSPAVGEHIVYDGNGFPFFALERINGTTKTTSKWEIYLGSLGALAFRDVTNARNPITFDQNGRTGFGLVTAPAAQVDIETLDNSIPTLALTRKSGQTAAMFTWAGVASGVIDVNGNVGIGITAPTAKLHIVGNADTQQLIVKANATQTSNLMELQNSSATVLSSIDNTGHWGIGVAPSTAYKFYVNSTEASVASAAELGFVYDYRTLNGTGYGIQGVTRASGADNVSELYGIWGRVNLNSGSAMVLANAYPLYGEYRRDSSVASQSTTNVKLISGGVVGSGTAPITNLYGLYLPAITAGATLNYAIYTNAGLNRFGDQISIVGGADRIQLSVRGTATYKDTTVFAGTGLNDFSTAGTYTGTVTGTFVCTIDATGTPDTFTWTINGAGGATGVAITGGNQTLQDGVTVKWTATTGHTLADKWTVVCHAQTSNIQSWLNGAGSTLASINPTGNWGMGTSALTYVKLRCAGTGDQTVDAFGQYNTLTYTPTADLDSSYHYRGAYNAVVINTSYDATGATIYDTFAGLENRAQITIATGKTVGVIYGATTFLSWEAANAGTTTNVYGDIIQGITRAGSTNTITNLYWLNIGYTNDLGTTTIGTQYGLYVRQMIKATTTYGIYVSAQNTAGTNTYGLYVSNITAATNNYAIYTGTGLVHFGDTLDLASGKNLTLLAGNITTDTTTGTKIGTATNQKLAFFNSTPIVQPSAYTQTYSTASKTVPNMTYAAPSGGLVTDAECRASLAQLAADVLAYLKVITAIIDDDQALGLKS